MQKIRCIIVAEEELTVKLLTEYVLQISYLDLTGVFKIMSDAINYLQNEKIDLILLDIDLSEILSYISSKNLFKTPYVIITNDSQRSTHKDLEIKIIDYLLKPFSFKEFTIAIKKAIKQIVTIRLNQLHNSSALYVMVDRKNIRIEFDSIIYIKSNREYVHIFTQSRNFISKISISEIEARLPKEKFKRIHRSYIVALNKIESFTKRQVIVNGKNISIGKDIILREFS